MKNLFSPKPIFAFPVILLASIIVILSGCGPSAAPKETAAVSGETSSARAVEQGTTALNAGLKEPCVGMGCEDEISAGLKEKCVGMGCPSPDAQ